MNLYYPHVTHNNDVSLAAYLQNEARYQTDADDVRHHGETAALLSPNQRQLFQLQPTSDWRAIRATGGCSWNLATVEHIRSSWHNDVISGSVHVSDTSGSPQLEWIRINSIHTKCTNIDGKDVLHNIIFPTSKKPLRIERVHILRKSSSCTFDISAVDKSIINVAKSW